MHSPAAHVRRPRLDYESHAIGLDRNADIEHLALERGHRTLVITRRGGRVVTIPLAPHTARAIDLAIGEPPKDRCSRPPTDGGWTGMPLRDVQEAASHADPRTTMR